MTLNKKKLIRFFLFAGIMSSLILITSQVSALEITYPTILGVQKPTSINISLPSYLKYLYNLSIVWAGILSFVLLVWGGLRYLFSAGKPGRMADAKEQISASLLGLMLIFASFLIINTINPELTKIKLFLPTGHFNSAPPPPPDTMTIGEVVVDEIPIGTLITSEFAASPFLSTTTPDISYASTSWPATSTGTSTRYSTDFQGALYSARLQRIHEIASTTLPVVDYLTMVLFQEFMDTEDEMMDKVNDLYKEAMSCNCSNCDCGSCYYTDDGTCICHCHCASDTCPNRKEMKKLAEEIPLYYDEDKNPNPPLPCKMAEIEYLSGAFKNFLNTSHLVKNDDSDYKDKSFWHSNEAVELRTKIDDCVTAGRIEGDQQKKIEELIDSMANVENKGTYSPETDAPERDIGENLNEVKTILNAMKRVKELINPFENPFNSHIVGIIDPSYNTKKNEEYLNLMTFAAMTSLETSGNFKSTIKNFGVFFSAGNETVKVIDDPATFYSVASMPPPFGNKDGLLPDKNKNLVFADIVDPDPITFDLESPPPTKGTCKHLTEIPIGKTLDEAIKLTQDIFRELKNINDEGHSIVEKTLKAVEEDGLAEQMFETDDKFIDFVLKIPKCPTGCISQQSGCSCICTQSDLMTDSRKNISKQYSRIKQLEQKIETIANKIWGSKKRIYESFYKLNSEYPDTYPENGKIVPHPKADQPKDKRRVPIGKNYFCSDKFGNCRDKKGELDTDKIEIREYTLKEKLAEVQKLLNRSRELVDPQGEKSVFRILMEQLIELKFAKKSELTYIESEDKYDLQNCGVIMETLKKTRDKEPTKELLNCRNAELTDAIDIKDKESCSPDPYLDLDFFNSTSSRARRPLSCYCYDENADRHYYNIIEFPELYKGFSFLGFGNNYYCCVTNYEE